MISPFYYHFLANYCCLKNFKLILFDKLAKLSHISNTLIFCLLSSLKFFVNMKNSSCSLHSNPVPFNLFSNIVWPEHLVSYQI